VKYLHENCRICGAHFEEGCFRNDLKNRLHETAVPSMFSCGARRKLNFEECVEGMTLKKYELIRNKLIFK
jgi:hypothetical protein